MESEPQIIIATGVSRRTGPIPHCYGAFEATAIQVPLEALRGESSIAELCRREGINSNLYYRWSKDLEACKRRLAGDTVREASTDEVVDLKKENTSLKQAVSELYLRNDWLDESSPQCGYNGPVHTDMRVVNEFR